MTANLSEIITDDEIIRVHGHANFGLMSPREVVNDGVRKSAVGYHCGHTQFTILREHSLITKPRGMSYAVSLTKKGKRYARALWHIHKADTPADWSEFEDDLSDVIQDSIDMDWTSRVGAKSVVRWLNERKYQ